MKINSMATMNNHLPFKSNSRVWQSYETGNIVTCYTALLRKDLDWNEFVDILSENFAFSPRVKILNYACSDGSEAYSLAILLKEKLGRQAEKFFPIKAKDIDGEIIKSAKSGRINIDKDDLDSLSYYYMADSSKYFTKTDRHLYILNDEPVSQKTTYEVNPSLRNNVEFSQKNIFEDLEEMEDGSKDTVLMFRNATPYLEARNLKKFIKLASQKLGQGSMLILGSYDMTYFNGVIQQQLRNNGFVPATSGTENCIFIKNKLDYNYQYIPIRNINNKDNIFKIEKENK